MEIRLDLSYLSIRPKSLCRNGGYISSAELQSKIRFGKQVKRGDECNIAVLEGWIGRLRRWVLGA